tara:strand:+ start:562 stop:807 length:246 start_codon:yes stop_codon:yes gene_type:complete
MKKLKNLWIKYASELGFPSLMIGLVLSYGTYKFHEQFAANYNYGDILYGSCAALMLLIGLSAILTSKFIKVEVNEVDSSVT